MKATRQISFLLFLFVWAIARCFPPVPLNERTTEKLTYEAYLLIEESLNQQKDSTVERRIKEKSIFIAPIISPGSSPECGPDRCKKLMPKKEIPLENLLQLINQEYGFMEENEEDITTGPLYINIPLKAVQEETDLTMLIEPTKNAESEVDRNTAPDEEKVDIADIAGILGMKKGDIQSSTSSATDISTEESTTETTFVNTLGSTTENNPFMFMDTKKEAAKTDAAITISSTTSNTGSTVSHSETTTLKNSFPDSDFTLYQMDQALPYVDSPISFVDVKREVEKAKNNYVMKENTSERPHTAFTVRSTLILPKKEHLAAPLSPKLSTSAPFKVPDLREPSSSTIIFTPIDNILSMEDSTKTVSTSSSIATQNFETNYDSSYGMNNNKLFPSAGSSNNNLFTTGPSHSKSEVQDINTGTESSRIVFPTSATYTSTRNFMVRFPTAQYMRFPTSTSPSVTPSYSSVISDRFGMESKSPNPLIDRWDKLKKVPDVNLTYAIPIHVNLTSLYERIKAQRENHRNREKQSEWFHLPSKWWDTSQRPPVLRISKKNGHMDVQEVSPDNFFRQFNGRSFDFKSAIQR